MILVGLTGSIGMGKSTTARMFAEEGVPVWDADSAVHRLYAPGGAAVEPVLDAFPGAGSEEAGIDREKLSALTLGRPEALSALEAIVHPLVREDQERFLAGAGEAGANMAVLDIPLLVENGMTGLFGEIVVVTADPAVRKTRVLERPGMSEAKLTAILERQAGEDERLAAASFVIRTDRGLPSARQEVKAVLRALREKHGLSEDGEAG